MILVYLDPGSGSFLIQLLIAAIAGLSIAIGANWSKLKRWLNRNKVSANPETDDDEDVEPKPLTISNEKISNTNLSNPNGSYWSRLTRLLGKKKEKTKTDDEDDDDEQQPGT